MSRTTTTATTTTPFLTEGNYTAWSKWVRSEILSLGVIDHLNGVNPAPAAITTSSSSDDRREARE